MVRHRHRSWFALGLLASLASSFAFAVPSGAATFGANQIDLVLKQDGTGHGTSAQTFITTANGFDIGDDSPHDGVVSSGDLVSYDLRLNFQAARSRTVKVSLDTSLAPYLSPVSGSSWCSDGFFVKSTKVNDTTCSFEVPGGIPETLNQTIQFKALDTQGTDKGNQVVRLSLPQGSIDAPPVRVVSAPRADVVVKAFPSERGWELDRPVDGTFKLEVQPTVNGNGASHSGTYSGKLDVSSFPTSTIWRVGGTQVEAAEGFLPLTGLSGDTLIDYVIPAEAVSDLELGGSRSYPVHFIADDNAFSSSSRLLNNGVGKEPGSDTDRDQPTSPRGNLFPNNSWSSVTVSRSFALPGSQMQWSMLAPVPARSVYESGPTAWDITTFDDSNPDIDYTTNPRQVAAGSQFKERFVVYPDNFEDTDKFSLYLRNSGDNLAQFLSSTVRLEDGNVIESAVVTPTSDGVRISFDVGQFGITQSVHIDTLWQAPAQAGSLTFNYKSFKGSVAPAQWEGSQTFLVQDPPTPSMPYYYFKPAPSSPESVNRGDEVCTSLWDLHAERFPHQDVEGTYYLDVDTTSGINGLHASDGWTLVSHEGTHYRFSHSDINVLSNYEGGVVKVPALSLCGTVDNFAPENVSITVTPSASLTSGSTLYEPAGRTSTVSFPVITSEFAGSALSAPSSTLVAKGSTVPFGFQYRTVTTTKEGTQTSVLRLPVVGESEDVWYNDGKGLTGDWKDYEGKRNSFLGDAHLAGPVTFSDDSSPSTVMYSVSNPSTDVDNPDSYVWVPWSDDLKDQAVTAIKVTSEFTSLPDSSYRIAYSQGTVPVVTLVSPDTSDSRYSPSRDDYTLYTGRMYYEDGSKQDSVPWAKTVSATTGNLWGYVKWKYLKTDIDIAGVVVHVASKDNPEDILQTTTTSKSGEYVFKNLIPGSYIVSVQRQDGTVTSTGVQTQYETYYGDITPVQGDSSKEVTVPIGSHLQMDFPFARIDPKVTVDTRLTDQSCDDSSCTTKYDVVIDNPGTQTIPANSGSFHLDLPENSHITSAEVGTVSFTPGFGATGLYNMQVWKGSGVPVAFGATWGCVYYALPGGVETKLTDDQGQCGTNLGFYPTSFSLLPVKGDNSAVRILGSPLNPNKVLPTWTLHVNRSKGTVDSVEYKAFPVKYMDPDLYPVRSIDGVWLPLIDSPGYQEAPVALWSGAPGLDEAPSVFRLNEDTQEFEVFANDVFSFTALDPWSRTHNWIGLYNPRVIPEAVFTGNSYEGFVNWATTNYPDLSDNRFSIKERLDSSVPYIVTADAPHYALPYMTRYTNPTKTTGTVIGYDALKLTSEQAPYIAPEIVEYHDGVEIARYPDPNFPKGGRVVPLLVQGFDDVKYTFGYLDPNGNLTTPFVSYERDGFGTGPETKFIELRDVQGGNQLLQPFYPSDESIPVGLTTTVPNPKDILPGSRQVLHVTVTTPRTEAEQRVPFTAWFDSPVTPYSGTPSSRSVDPVRQSPDAVPVESRQAIDGVGVSLRSVPGCYTAGDAGSGGSEHSFADDHEDQCDAVGTLIPAHQVTPSDNPDDDEVVTTVKGTIWLDKDGNSLLDESEVGSVTTPLRVEVYEDDVLKGTVFTDSQGKYSIDVITSSFPDLLVQVYPGSLARNRPILNSSYPSEVLYSWPRKTELLSHASKDFELIPSNTDNGLVANLGLVDTSITTLPDTGLSGMALMLMLGISVSVASWGISRRRCR